MKASIFSFSSRRSVRPWSRSDMREGSPIRTSRRRFPGRKFGPGRVTAIGLVFGLCLLVLGQVHAQVEVNMALNKAVPQPIKIAVEWDQNATDRLKKGTLPGGIKIQLTRLEGEEDTYELRLDSNADSSLDDETEYRIHADQDLSVEIERRFSAQRSEWLPYTISYKIFTDRKGKRRELFFLSPQYQAEGTLKLGPCSAKLLLLDLNGDGFFDQMDGKGGSNLGLDMDGNQKIHGREEWHRVGTPIHFCQKSFTLAITENDGSKLVLSKSDARPRLAPNTRLPLFNFEATEGKTYYSHHLKSKAHLLAFWATWSKQSLRNTIHLKRLKADFDEKLAIIAVNVDKEAQLTHAKNMARHQNGDWVNVILGKGNKDPVWQNIRDTTGAPSVVPYYVILDHKGFIRYQGTGGQKLARLRKMLYKLYPGKDPRFLLKGQKKSEPKKRDQKPGRIKKGS